MKKRYILITCLGLMGTGCSNSEAKADTELLCHLQSNNGESVFSSTLSIEYNKEEKEVISGKLMQEYKNLDKSETNNTILNQLVIKQAVLDALDGVKATVDTSDTGFTYMEKWKYRDVDTKSAVEADEKQEMYIKDGKYTITKIKQTYEDEGYSCYSEKLK